MKVRYFFILLVFILLFSFVFIKENCHYEHYENENEIYKIISGPNRYTSYPVVEVLINGENILEVLNSAIELAKSIGYVPKYSLTRGNKLILHYDVPEITLDIIRAILRFGKNIPEQEKEKLSKRYRSLRLGPSTKSIIDECQKNEIPYIRLNESSLFQVGYGKNKKMIEASCTSNTMLIPEMIAKDKDLTKKILHKIGVPVPKGYYIQGKQELLQKYRLFNTPVVLKPYNGNHGDGVITNIRSEKELVEAYDIVKKINPAMLIESFISGNDYRVLVVDYKVIAVAKRTPPFVIGDGSRTIFELVQELNLDPKRGEGHSALLSHVEFDDVMVYYLASKGMTKHTIPTKGEKVILRNNGNLSSGGSAEDVTDQIHPDTTYQCEMACRQVGLNICGLDIVCNDISVPLSSQNGAIIEMNSGPGLRMHISPNVGKGHNVATSIVSDLFPDGKSRIPIVSITGTNGKTTTVQLVSHILRGVCKTVGKTTTNGVYVNDDLIIKGDCSGPSSAESILSNPDVEAAVFEVARGGILRRGLGYDKASVGCITNIGNGDHLGKNYEDSTIDDIIEIKSTVIRNIVKDGYVVLNMDDKHYDKLRDMVSSSVRVITFSLNKNKYSDISYDRFRREISGDRFTFQVDRIGIYKETEMDFQLENIMAAIGCSLACGVPPSVIQQRLENFVNDYRTNPGRMNVIPYENNTIVLDYAHNIDSIKNICKYASQSRFDDHEKIVVYSPAGDREEETLGDIVRELSDCFDDSIFFVDDDTKRGRSTDELFSIISRNSKNSHNVYGETKAIDVGFERMSKITRPVLFMILVDDVNRSIDNIISKIKK